MQGPEQVLLLLVAWVHIAASFHHNTRRPSPTQQYLFGLFGGGFNKPKTDVPTAAKAPGKQYQLEKISNTQNRDWKKEGEAIDKARKPAPVLDKQKSSFNFGKPNEFPNLYGGWIKAEGDVIAKQMVSSAKAALSTKKKYIEIVFDPVPNLDEVAYGTEWNLKFRKEISSFLKVPDFATNRGGPSTLEWSNLYWAARLSSGLGLRTLVISISGEGMKGQYLPTLPKGMQLITLQDSRVAARIEAADKPQLVVMISPCTAEHYQQLKSVADKLSGVPAVALNCPFSFRYDIGGGAPFELSYCMKRIPKGWIFRRTPGEFEAIVEGPNYEITKVQSFKTQPTLPAITKINMAASAAKYQFNDRIFENRL